MPHNINRTASSQDTSFKPSRTLKIKHGKVQDHVEANSKLVEYTENEGKGKISEDSIDCPP